MTRTEKIISKLIKKSTSYVNKGKYEIALAMIESCSSILYQYNQFYVSEELENSLKVLTNFITEKTMIRTVQTNSNTVLFYDGFGLDGRGLATIYLNAIINSGYKLIYVTKKTSENKQPNIEKILSNGNVEIYYIDNRKKYLSYIYDLIDIYKNTKPRSVFLYTYPSDVSGVVAFNCLKDVSTRFQINLTDHAFWLGNNAFDYCIEYRNYGANISKYYRNIDESKILLLPYYANINYDEEFIGLPFDCRTKRYIFSGGALYKTLGDKNNTFYSIVDKILENNKDLVFLYAGSGDATLLLKLQDKFKDRVFYISERKDLYQIMKRCVLYLNTYPLAGGLMMNYAAASNKIPITLSHYNDSDGALLNQDRIDIMYNDENELVRDVNRLLVDSEYREKREAKLLGSVLTSEVFDANLHNIIELSTTNFKVEYNKVDVTEIRREYKERFNYSERVSDAFYKKRNIVLLPFFPSTCAAAFYSKVKRKIKNKG